MNALCLESLGNLDAPRRRDAALPPLQACGSAGAQLGGGCIDGLPSEGGISHSPHFGRFVQIVKDELPEDSQGGAWHNLSMPQKQPSSEYVADLTARVKSLRTGMRTSDGAQWSAETMAKALGIPADRYRKYESRTPLPHELLEQFALIVGVTVEYLVTGNKPTDIRKMRYKKHAVDSSKQDRKRA